MVLEWSRLKLILEVELGPKQQETNNWLAGCQFELDLFLREFVFDDLNLGLGAIILFEIVFWSILHGDYKEKK